MLLGLTGSFTCAHFAYFGEGVGVKKGIQGCEWPCSISPSFALAGKLYAVLYAMHHASGAVGAESRALFMCGFCSKHLQSGTCSDQTNVTSGLCSWMYLKI